ncbi:hypothetical protein EUTSA_v10009850mg [Eutrema salsugineum]|uniref:F-box domain-containing protein n=2 Tax=Eutrema salsugineum TaxID=72664 RepID=V4KEL3_EUTSA|nr:hypothetical protein EUTSA_v10009850mg [Eutrema salsugineum]
MRVDQVDRISKLPDHVLLKILGELCTEEAVQTSILSKRWEGVWKQMPFLNFDMRKTIEFEKSDLADRSHDHIAQLITKVINNHDGYLDCCKIKHFSIQSKDGTVETWIRTLTHVKHTKYLALFNIRSRRWRPGHVLYLSPNTFSHPALISLFLFRYDLEFAHAFNNCHNLITLRLEKICAEVGVFNTILASCPSLKWLVLDITWFSERGCLKIHNNNLKLLHLACTYIDCIDVSAPLLEIFSINCTFVTRDNFLLAAPRILEFSKNSWVAAEYMPHISYNISCYAQGNQSSGHEYTVRSYAYYLRCFTSFAVNVDLMNQKEVYMLKEVLDAWGGDVRKLEIFFKHNNVCKEEGESSNDGAPKKKGEYFNLKADIRVKEVWMYNFNGLNKGELWLASRFVMQGTMLKKLMIKTSSIYANNKLEIKVAMDKLMELPKGNEELSIEFY